MELITMVGKFFKYYRLFGLSGIKFLAKRATKKNAVITILPKNYKHPIYLRNNTSDIDVFSDIFCGLDYEIDYPGFPKTIIDCGANVGLASVYYKNKFPESTIIAIEPERSNFEMLLKNTEKYQNVHCLNNGIWNKPANLEIVDSGQGYWNFSTHEVEYENKNTIKAISINEIIERYDIKEIDILKIDIEGSEKEMFEKNYERWLAFTKTIIIELHDWKRAGCTKSVFKAIGQYNFCASFLRQSLIFKIERA